MEFWYDGKGLSSPQTPNYAKGKLTKVDNGISATLDTQFDNFGRLTQSSQVTDGQTYTSNYQYSLSGALVQETYPSGRVVKNEFESDGDLQDVVSKKAGGSVFTPYVSNFSYTASGGISQMKLGNGRWETAKFNERLQAYELGLGAGPTDTSLWKVHYDFGELSGDGNSVDGAKNTGNIARQVITVPGTSFTDTYRYDALYRLTEGKEPNGTSTPNWVQNWTYDRYGNRVTFTQNVGGNSFAPNPDISSTTNRFTSTSFVYDKNGNIVTDVDPVTSLTRTFTFNGDNKQIAVSDTNGGIGQYFYDGEGKRVKKVTGSETTIFVYSSGKLVAEYSTQLATNPSINYTTTDHLGSPRVITNQLGEVESRRDFMPFGEEIYAGIGARTGSTGLKYSTGADAVRQKFTGYQKDEETGLDFAEARMYRNSFGRFTAVDPLLASGNSGIPQTFNRYIYVGNNPLNITDPLGQKWWQHYNNETNRWDWREQDDSPGTDWKEGDYHNGYVHVTDLCINGTCSPDGYLYQNGGYDVSGRRAKTLDDFMGLTRADEQYCQYARECLALRNPEVRNAASDVMASGAAVFNIPFETYNFGAWGANQFGADLPYSPTLQPDENTRPGAKLFFHGTNIALAAEGGISLYKGVRSFFSLEGATNLASAERTTHILSGDGLFSGSGGHAWGRSLGSTWNGLSREKTMFPMTWSNRKIITAINEVATNPNSRWINQTGRPGAFFTNAGNAARFRVEGVYSGVSIRVIVEGSDIRTAHPF